MADVFISYKSERRRAVEHLAQILRINGYSVWYDAGLTTGEDFSSQIERELHASLAVVTLWCRLSVNSEWVKEEAHLAKKLNKAIPVIIEPVALPFGFGLSDTVDLSRWNGSPRSPDLDRFMMQVAQKVGRDPSPNMRAMIEFEEPWKRYGSPTLAQFAIDPAAASRDAEREKSGLARLARRVAAGAGAAMGAPPEAALAGAGAAAASAGRGGLIALAAAASLAIAAGAGYVLWKPAAPAQPPASAPLAANQAAPPAGQTTYQTASVAPKQEPVKRAGVLVLADDSQPDSVARSNPIVRRLSRELSQALAANGLTTFEEGAVLPELANRERIDLASPDIAGRMKARSADIDLVLTYRVYVELQRIPLAQNLLRPSVRIVGRLSSLTTGQSVGSLEPAIGSIAPIAASCDAQCLLDAIITELRIAATDLGRFAIEKSGGAARAASQN